MGQLWIVALWFAHTTFALPSRDGDEQEYFPLSGGIANGVMVTIEAEIDTSKKASIEFLTPAREVAFGWYMDVSAKTLKHGHRNRSMEAIYPSAALSSELQQGSQIKLGFMKRRFQWGVSVNNQVQSWYSFPIPVEELVTHVSVHSGFANPEVVQQRQQCTVQCHEDECRGAEGKNVCESEPCYTTRRSAKPFEAEECSNAGEANDVHENCCDGKPMTIPHSSEYDGKWVQLIAAAEMTDFCREYNCGTNWVTVAGRPNTKGLVQSTDGNSSYTVAVPGAQTVLQSDNVKQFPEFSDSHMKIPNLVLRRSVEGKMKVILNVSSDLPLTNYKLDASRILVETTLADHIEAQGWFLEYVAVPFKGDDGNVTVRLMRGPTAAGALRENKNSPNADFYYSDQGAEPGVCADAPYKGEGAINAVPNATCADWTDKQWCHPWGQKAPALCNGTGIDPNICPNPAWRPEGLNQCCSCGGGSWTPASLTHAFASHLMFQ